MIFEIFFFSFFFIFFFWYPDLMSWIECFILFFLILTCFLFLHCLYFLKFPLLVCGRFVVPVYDFYVGGFPKIYGDLYITHEELKVDWKLINWWTLLVVIMCRLFFFFWMPRFPEFCCSYSVSEKNPLCPSWCVLGTGQQMRHGGLHLFFYFTLSLFLQNIFAKIYSFIPIK